MMILCLGFAKVLCVAFVKKKKNYQQEFGILTKDTVFVTDNGSNVTAAFKDYVRISCAGHNINLILKHVFDHLDEDNPVHIRIIKLFRDTKTLVTHFKRAG
ncbi:hypothetical protein AMECASPLE_039579 [Ameca splendens]|uniref:Uncharacterized protein n=1 Tax=Ameca splendens TaxID=208324 RepID=A0ABV0ZJS7_9TELE